MNTLNLSPLLAQMQNSARIIHSLVQGLSDEQARWKPTPERWSILEVINHLWDEEIEDFRAHVEHVLERPEQPWPPINPPQWAIDRRYNERELGASIQGFVEARAESLVWLKAQSSPNWDAAAQAPFGPIRAGDVLAAWAAHDLLHTRQLVRLHFDYTAQAVAPYSTRYAGQW